MINLLPEDYKQAYLYARKNTQLAHWCAAIIAVTFACAVLMFGGWWYIAQSTKNYEKQVAQARLALEAGNLSNTQTKVQEISNSLKLIEQVLSKQILFSKLIRQIGIVMPEGAVLSNIELPAFEGGINILAEAKDYKTATQVQINLSDPRNKIFDKADIVSITCSNNDGGQSNNNDQSSDGEQNSFEAYPCTINLRAQFAKENPFLFINTNKGGNR